MLLVICESLISTQLLNCAVYDLIAQIKGVGPAMCWTFDVISRDVPKIVSRQTV